MKQETNDFKPGDRVERVVLGFTNFAKGTVLNDPKPRPGSTLVEWDSNGWKFRVQNINIRKINTTKP